MAKTKEELDALKQECETLAIKLKELTDDELMQVTGGKMGLNFTLSIGTAVSAGALLAIYDK